MWILQVQMIHLQWDAGGPFGNQGYVDDGKFISNAGHNSIWDSIGIDGRNEQKVAPAWIMVGYGICLNAKCGD